MGDLHGAIAAHGDQGVEAETFEVLCDLVGPIRHHLATVGQGHRVLEGVAAVAGAEYCAAQVGDAAHHVVVEL